MSVRLLFFSVLRDITGLEEASWPFISDMQVKDLLEQLYQRWPKLRDWDRSLLIAVDQTYVKRDEHLQQGSEVALMPPVQGG